MPYETGYPKCRTFGMSDSAQYPGLCKPYEIETNSGNDYPELTHNSINSQPSPHGYYTYKTLNGQYDGKVDKSYGLISNNDNVPPSSRTRLQIYNTNPSSNSAAYSYNKRQDAIASSQTQNQQKQQRQTQFYNNNQQNYRTITSTSTTKSPSQSQQKQQTNFYHLSPLERSTPLINQQVQQQTEPKRELEKNEISKHQMEHAFRTYRWDLLFKKNHLL